MTLLKSLVASAARMWRDFSLSDVVCDCEACVARRAEREALAELCAILGPREVPSSRAPRELGEE